jgi:hypothetical protein
MLDGIAGISEMSAQISADVLFQNVFFLPIAL